MIIKIIKLKCIVLEKILIKIIFLQNIQTAIILKNHLYHLLHWATYVTALKQIYVTCKRETFVSVYLLWLFQFS